MLLAEIAVGAAAPARDEIGVQYGADARSEHRNESAGNLLSQLAPCLFSDPLGQPFDNLLPDPVASHVHASGAGSGEPEFGLLFFGGMLEAVNQPKLLDKTKSDDGEEAHVRQ